MDALRGQLIARAALSENQDRKIAGSEAADPFERSEKGGTLPHHVSQRNRSAFNDRSAFPLSESSQRARLCAIRRPDLLIKLRESLGISLFEKDCQRVPRSLIASFQPLGRSESAHLAKGCHGGTEPERRNTSRSDQIEIEDQASGPVGLQVGERLPVGQGNLIAGEHSEPERMKGGAFRFLQSARGVSSLSTNRGPFLRLQRIERAGEAQFGRGFLWTAEPAEGAGGEQVEGVGIRARREQCLAAEGQGSLGPSQHQLEA